MSGGRFGFLLSSSQSCSVAVRHGAEPKCDGRRRCRIGFPERPRRRFLSGLFVSAHALPALRCSRLGRGLWDVRVVRPSRGPRASRACSGHPRSRAAQVVGAPGIFPHRAAPRRPPAVSAETRILPGELASGFSEILGSYQNSGTALPKLWAPVPALPRSCYCLPLNPVPSYPRSPPCSPKSWGYCNSWEAGCPALFKP